MTLAPSYAQPIATLRRDLLLRQVVEDVPAAPAFVALARFSYLAGAFFPTSQGAGPVVIHSEAGVLAFHVEKPVVLTPGGAPGQGQTMPAGSDFTIRTGDQLLVPGAVPHTAKSEGPETAITMGVAMFQQAPVLQFPAGVDFHPLALGFATALPASPALETVERLTIPAGGSPVRLSPTGFRLVSVESGSLGVSIVSGGAGISRGIGAGTVPGSAPPAAPPAGGAPPGGGGPPQPDPVPPGTTAQLSAGDALILQADADATLLPGSEGAQVLFARIEPSLGAGGREVAESFFYDAWDRGNADLVDQLFSADYVNHNPLAGQQAGPAGIKQLIRRFHEAFPDFSVSVDLMLAERDRVVTRYTFRGTHQGVFLGVQPTGKPVEITGITILGIDGGVIRESWGYWEQISLLAQLGVIQLPTGTSAQR